MLREYLTRIANAIRSVLGTSESINAQDFADKVVDVYEAGKQAEWSDFWDSFQQNGVRDDYSSAFTKVGWTDITFKPKYDITTVSASSMFYRCKIKDLQGILDKCGVTIDFSQTTTFDNCFQESTITEIGIVNVTGATKSVTSLVQNCYYLNGIEKLIVKETNTFNASCFANCSSLFRIKVEGVIGSTTGFPNSPLIKESIESIINALSGTASGMTLTLKLTAVKKAFETSSGANNGNTSEEWLALVASKSNWTITLA